MPNIGVNYKKEYSNYLIKDEALLYKIADAKLLNKMSCVTHDKFEEGKRIWYFDKDPDILKVMREYNTEKKKNDEILEDN